LVDKAEIERVIDDLQTKRDLGNTMMSGYEDQELKTLLFVEVRTFDYCIKQLKGLIT
jgi:hypothetical protein